jgi:dihydropteroate synthase
MTTAGKNTAFSSKHLLKSREKVIKIDRPLVMGILNLTPDSFYDGGFYNNEPDMLQQVEKMIAEGADIIDMGAVSTRPGSIQVTPEEEEARLFPALELVRKRFGNVVISIDTFRASIARTAIGAGADMVNDISGGSLDDSMAEAVAGQNIPYIMMHMQGEPSNMQLNPSYDDVVQDVSGFFTERLQSLRRKGVEQVILDPGFGFGKSLLHNYELLRNLGRFYDFGLPIMVGLSRKSFINKVLGTRPSGALNGTTVLNTLAVINGAHILRVHDVREAVETVMLCREYLDVGE